MIYAGDTTTIMGVDLGQQRDYTAISIIERVCMPVGEKWNEDYFDQRTGRMKMRARQKVVFEYRVRHLERPPIGLAYTDQVDRIVSLIKHLGGDLVLAVDQTGVGRPVVDLLWLRLSEDLKGTDIRVTPATITITGGDSASRAAGGGLRVPKRDLISAPLVLMQNKLLKVADALELKDTLVRELANFRLKINIATGHDSYEAWREGDHDDLVLSVALATWCGERYLPKPESVVLPGEIVADAPVTFIGKRR